MVELFEDEGVSNDRQSSKGNQLKWKRQNTWYKADYTGYEGLAEYVISMLLNHSNLKKSEYVLYELEEIKYKNRLFNGVSSNNFLMNDWQIITIERLFKNVYGRSLYQSVWSIPDHVERLRYLVSSVENVTGLRYFGRYMNIILTIDAMFLNEDRHFHNIAVLMDSSGNFNYCPIFDQGAGLLSDTSMDYPLGDDIYKLIDSVQSKTFSYDFDEQMEISERLFGNNVSFSFTKNDIDQILSLELLKKMYSNDIIERIRTILYDRMRKYPYLFNNDR